MHGTFAHKLAEGRMWEMSVAHSLKQRGYYVVPSYDYSGGENKSPKLQGSLAEYVIPDLDTANSGKRYWIEIKSKNNSGTLHRKTGVVEHGFNQRHFDHYCKVQEITGTPVHVYVVEIPTKVVLSQSLDNLIEVKRPYNGDQMGPGGMVFFPRISFDFRFLLPEVS